ncbi:MAG: glycosyltransferase N-terminal domain-containing protein, partial [Flavobacteriales bacterium]
MPLLYDLGTALYHAAIRATVPFNSKARAWVQGRKDVWQRLEAKSGVLKGCLWMHCASVGEFEQGRPVLEALKAEHPDTPVLLTFFSPSGYEALKQFPLAEHVEYLPADSAANARRLLALIEPSKVLWVKYEFWYHYLAALHKGDVPTYLVSAIFRAGQPFFRWYGSTHRSMLRCFRHLFVQDERSRALLAGIAITDVTVSGDTRFDRVDAIRQGNSDLPIATGFSGSGPVLVCGSIWPADEKVLESTLWRMELPLKCIVVPHELDKAMLRRTEGRFPRPLVRWSELQGSPPKNARPRTPR